MGSYMGVTNFDLASFRSIFNIITHVSRATIRAQPTEGVQPSICALKWNVPPEQEHSAFLHIRLHNPALAHMP